MCSLRALTSRYCCVVMLYLRQVATEICEGLEKTAFISVFVVLGLDVFAMVYLKF